MLIIMSRLVYPGVTAVWKLHDVTACKCKAGVVDTEAFEHNQRAHLWTSCVNT